MRFHAADAIAASVPSYDISSGDLMRQRVAAATRCAQEAFRAESRLHRDLRRLEARVDRDRLLERDAVRAERDARSTNEPSRSAQSRSSGASMVTKRSG